MLVAEHAVHLRRTRVAPERLAAIGIMNRRRRTDQFGLATLAEQRKPNGRDDARIVLAEDVPDLRDLNDLVPSSPQFDFVLVAPVETIAVTPCFARELSRFMLPGRGK